VHEVPSGGWAGVACTSGAAALAYVSTRYIEQLVVENNSNRSATIEGWCIFLSA
jgi:hypothetical protein